MMHGCAYRIDVIDIWCRADAYDQLCEDIRRGGYEKTRVLVNDYRLTFEEIDVALEEHWHRRNTVRNAAVVTHIISNNEKPKDILKHLEVRAHACFWDGSAYSLENAHLVLQKKTLLHPKIPILLRTLSDRLREYYFVVNASRSGFVTPAPEKNDPAATVRWKTTSAQTELMNRSLVHALVCNAISLPIFYHISHKKRLDTPLQIWQRILEAACIATRSFHSDAHHRSLRNIIICGEVDACLHFILSLLERLDQYRKSGFQIENEPQGCHIVATLIKQRMNAREYFYRDCVSRETICSHCENRRT